MKKNKIKLVCCALSLALSPQVSFAEDLLQKVTCTAIATTPAHQQLLYFVQGQAMTHMSTEAEGVIVAELVPDSLTITVLQRRRSDANNGAVSTILENVPLVYEGPRLGSRKFSLSNKDASLSVSFSTGTNGISVRHQFDHAPPTVITSKEEQHCDFY